jgi:hypothetical protein
MVYSKTLIFRRRWRCVRLIAAKAAQWVCRCRYVRVNCMGPWMHVCAQALLYVILTHGTKIFQELSQKVRVKGILMWLPHATS